MKTRFTIVASLLLMAAISGLAMTVEEDITAAYVSKHPSEFSVKVARGKDGLLVFTVKRTLTEPRYFVAQLTVRHAGRTVAESNSPSYGKKYDNTFYFSLSPEDVAESKFVLGESNYVQSGDDFVPVPGTVNYSIHLHDFVPEDLLKPNTGK
jgi:hypothetical protein